jgi:hypothetical protein
MRCAAVSDTIALGPSRNGGYKKYVGRYTYTEVVPEWLVTIIRVVV